MADQGHYIIGTAGHVDHGKTALINALTGVETDRLREEKERGISIELGFAPLDLGGGELAGVVDVPGHEKFIPQMLSGIAGIDLVLLVVDANEGVMPQTREHLQIMQLLQVKRGILVLSKCDLVEPDWLDIVEEEIREQVSGSFLDKAPCCRVSALTGEGLEALREEIQNQLQRLPPRDSSGAVRMPVDRCFSISGFGTVVTGTIASGRVSSGDSLEVLPAGITARVREIQVHGAPQLQASAGQRTALNFSGLSREQVPRGSVIGTPGLFRATERIDVRLQLLPDAPRSLEFRTPLHFHLGTARCVALAVLLDREELKPGEDAIVQLILDHPLLAHRGDRFIVRSYSPMLTIGGGLVIDSAPKKHKRFRPEVIRRLEELESGDLGFWLQKLDALGITRLRDLEKQTGTGREQLQAGLVRLQAEGRVCQLGEQWASSELVRSWQLQLPTLVDDFLRRNPLSHGMPRATLQARISQQLAPKGFDVLLQQLLDDGVLQVGNELVAPPDWRPQPTAEETAILGKLTEHYRERGFQVKNCNEVLNQLELDKIDSDLFFGYLTQEQILVRLNQENYLHRVFYQQALKELVRHFSEHSSLTLAQFRDRLDSGRKLIQALLEYFDSCKFTRRTGEQRVPWKLPDNMV